MTSLFEETTVGVASSSTLLCVILGILRSRIPSIPSLRRSLGAYKLSSSLSSSSSPALLVTRPQVACPELKLCDQSQSDVRSLSDLELARQEDIVPFSVPQSGPNEKWKFANQGLKLLGSSAVELRYPPTRRSGAFARHLYVSGASSVLRGLPEELTAGEVAVLRGSMPQLLIGGTSVEDQQRPASHKGTSLLRRLLTSSIVQIFLLLALVLPYIRLGLQRAWQYERAHRLCERMFAASLDAMDSAGSKLVALTREAASQDNGQLAGVLIAAVLYGINGIIGGINDGVDKGIAIVRSSDAKSSGPRSSRKESCAQR